MALTDTKLVTDADGLGSSDTQSALRVNLGRNLDLWEYPALISGRHGVVGLRAGLEAKLPDVAQRAGQSRLSRRRLFQKLY